LGLIELGLADQEREASLGRDKAGGDGEGGVEALDCAEDYYFCWAGKVFRAGGKYIDVRQCKFTRDLAEEGCFLLVGLDQGEVSVGRPDFYGKSGEACAGSDVDERARTLGATLSCGEEMPGGEEGFAEMASHDFVFAADGGQVDVGVPAE